MDQIHFIKTGKFSNHTKNQDTDEVVKAIANLLLYKPDQADMRSKIRDLVLNKIEIQSQFGQNLKLS